MLIANLAFLGGPVCLISDDFPGVINLIDEFCVIAARVSISQDPPLVGAVWCIWMYLLKAFL